MKTLTITESPSQGLNRVDPAHLIKPGQVRESKNLLPYFGKLVKTKGTTRYNTTALSYPVTWAHRFYGRREDGSESKKSFLFAGGTTYVGNDATGALTAAQGGFQASGYPSDETMQVSGNIVLFFFNDGLDVPYTYDGNDGNVFNKSSITLKPVQGVSWLDRLWVFEKDDNVLYYSKTLYPENFTDSTDAGEATIGIRKGEKIMGLTIYADTLYIFTNYTMYRIEGRTPATFQLRIVHPSLGLAATHALVNVETTMMFLGSDYEIYSSGGTQGTTKIMSRDLDFSSMLDRNHAERVTATYHDHWVRFAYQPSDVVSGSTYNSDEILFNTLDPASSGQPKWGHIRGTRVACYSVWDRQGDKNELVTGRSDIGCLMYHNRTDNFDGSAIETKVLTRDILLSPYRNARIKEYHILGAPEGDYNVQFKTYLNGRTDYPTNDPLNLKGETVSLGLINISTQVRMNDRIIPDIDYSRGQSVAFEIYDNTANRAMEIYSITSVLRTKERLTSQIVGS